MTAFTARCHRDGGQRQAHLDHRDDLPRLRRMALGLRPLLSHELSSSCAKLKYPPGTTLRRVAPGVEKPSINRAFVALCMAVRFAKGVAASAHRLQGAVRRNSTVSGAPGSLLRV